MSDAVTFDAGALIALEGRAPFIRELLRELAEMEAQVLIPAGVLAQVYRGGPRQHALRRLLAVAELVTVVPLDAAAAMRAGALCASAGTSDVVDASVVGCAVQHSCTTIVTSDPGDLAKLGPGLRLVTV